MKTFASMLALSAACMLVGCNADGSMRTANNDDRMGMQHMHDGMTHTNVAGNAANSKNVPDDPQLRHGNDKTIGAVALSNMDRQFILDAGAGGMYEVQSSQKALMKASDARLKTIAQTVLDDHTKANSQLKALAQRKGVDLPLPTAEQIQMLARLDSLSGTAFDREFVTQQKAAHEKAIAQFQMAANGSTDRDIRDWATQTLPVLRGHMDHLNNTTNIGAGN